MNEQKQIEEMANIIRCKAEQLPRCPHTTCSICKATELYNAGYRKQNVGEWKDCFNGKYANAVYMCSICGKGTLLKPDINELGNMEMVQALSPFCPNCGAKMKGDAE